MFTNLNNFMGWPYAYLVAGIKITITWKFALSLSRVECLFSSQLVPVPLYTAW